MHLVSRWSRVVPLTDADLIGTSLTISWFILLYLPSHPYRLQQAFQPRHGTQSRLIIHHIIISEAGLHAVV